MGVGWYGMVWYGMVWYGMVWYGRDAINRVSTIPYHTTPQLIADSLSGQRFIVSKKLNEKNNKLYSKLYQSDSR
jgi:hypothetical protein